MKIYTVTDVGIGRSNNEDCYAIINDTTFLVADGMGGYAAGEVASQMMADIARRELTACQTIDEKVMGTVIRQANAEIIAASTAKPEYKGMGTTVVMFHYQENNGYWANVGDSRCYLLRRDKFKQLSKDHSLVAEMLAEGSLSQKDAVNHPQRNVLTRAVGAEKRIKVDSGKFKLADGDKSLLCTDGITTVLSDTDIRQILSEDVPDPAQALIKAAMRAGSRDNLTAVVLINKTEGSEG